MLRPRRRLSPILEFRDAVITMPSMRADQLVVEQGLAPTRAKAQALILAGAIVADNDRRVEKPGERLEPTVTLRRKGEPMPFVSRGGLKLDAALEHFGIGVRDQVCLDVGASTGGFTDCLLQRGARRVYSVDVGYGQMAWQLRQDPRVVLMERTNIRHIQKDALPEICSRVVADVSFISLRLVIPPVLALVGPGAMFVCLVKPQFEVGREHVGKGGIVRDNNARQQALDDTVAAFSALKLDVLGTMASPITGAKGNCEFLLAARNGAAE